MSKIKEFLQHCKERQAEGPSDKPYEVPLTSVRHLIYVMMNDTDEASQFFVMQLRTYVTNSLSQNNQADTVSLEAFFTEHLIEYLKELT